MLDTLFTLTLTVETITVIFVFISLALPKRRLWPPDSGPIWKRALMPTAFVLSGSGVVLLGILDWDASALPAWLRWAGIPLWLGGNGLAVWAGYALGRVSTWGAEGALIRRGPYRFSRNPQYVGFILGLAGWALMARSLRVVMAALVGILPLLLVPFAEEAWLTEKLGEPYEQYRRTVPRFLSFKSLFQHERKRRY